MLYATEIKGEWFGVSIPPWLRAFDCRQELDLPWARAPWGAALLSGEKAEVDLGLHGVDQVGHFSHATTPRSCLTHLNALTADSLELTRQVTDMVSEAARMHDEYHKIKRSRKRPGLHGGEAVYLPIAVEMSNFGWSIICDRRISVTKYF
jgi:hypothetical protein